MEESQAPSTQMPKMPVMANQAGTLFSSALAALMLFGHAVPEPVTISVLAVASLASNLFGLWGHKKAKQKVDDIFFNSQSR